MEPLDCICRFLDEDYDGLDEDEDQLFSLRPIRDEWRQLFDKYDPEGFGEIPLDDFEVALETRDFLEAISPGKLIILQVNLMFTLWCQLEDMFQLIGTPQGIERVMVQIKVTPQFFEKYSVKYKA